ncbi:MAG: NAD(P)-binding domain-containing protein, partial [Chloroflexota bacterium]|nr:NAD(P)-binding domain-containing protein [Chloroflexota bacterium]
MNVGVLGTGMVGQTIASRLVALGHDVRMGARDAANERARQWAAGAGTHAGHGTFADAAAFGALLV